MKPTYKFLSTLNVFAAALLSHYANLRALHAQNSKYKLRSPRNALSLKIPSIFLKLSEVLPSRNKSPRTGKQWANDIIKLSFLGLDTSPSRLSLPTPLTQTPTAGLSKQNIPDERAVMVTEARIVIPDRESLSVLQENFDQDIAYDKRTGSFAIRLRSVVGEPIIRSLVENFNRIEHFVDFINVLDKHKESIHSETTSLGKLVFTYGPEGMGGRRLYQATVNFGMVNSSMTIDFEQGNQHLRIQDSLTRVLNDKQGLDGVASLLPITLPALRALDTIEEKWLNIPEKGEVIIFVRTAEWYIVRYNMALPPSADGCGPMSRRIMFEIKLQHRKLEPWWYIRRTDSHDRDQIDLALNTIWNSTGEGWRGMRVSAVAEPRGAGELLGKVDEVLRTVDLHNSSQQQQPVLAPPKVAPVAPVAPVASVAPVAPVAPMAPMQKTASTGPMRPQLNMNMQNPQRQQPPSNTSQNNSQGRNVKGASTKREIVEID